MLKARLANIVGASMEPLVLASTTSIILVKHEKAIFSLKSVDEGFSETWADYIEVLHQIQSNGLNDFEEVELERLRATLEAEILETLGLRQQRIG
jgi:hypothetical protein